MRNVDKAAPARRTRLTAGQRRESILDAATEVFAAAGYRAGKVSDVAAMVGVTEPVAAGTLADHLADLLRCGQADGDIRADTDPGAAAWLLLSVLSARRLRTAARPDPDRIEGGVVALTLQALAPPTPAPPLGGHDNYGRARHR